MSDEEGVDISDSIPEIFLEEVDFEKNRQTTIKHEKLHSM